MSPVRQAPVTLVRRRQHPCFPLSFPIPAHVERPETGSMVTAFATTQLCATGRFPESERKAPNWRGSVRRFVLRDGIVTVGRSFLRIFLWPRNSVSRKRRPREAEIRFECRVTPKEVRASGAAETTRRACRRGAPLPCHEAAAPRWPLSRDRAPGRQATSSC